MQLLLTEYIDYGQLVHQLNDWHEQKGVGAADGIANVSDAQLDGLCKGVDGKLFEILQIEFGRYEELLVGFDLHFRLANN